MDGIENLKVNEDRKLYVAGSYHVVMEGDYRGRHFVIVNCRSHPCAYIEVKDKDAIARCYKMHCMTCGNDCVDCVDIMVHGGPTFYGSSIWDKHDQRSYVGWDYAHLGDYIDDGVCVRGIDRVDDKRWTIEEILMDVASAWVGLEKQTELPEWDDGT